MAKRNKSPRWWSVIMWASSVEEGGYVIYKPSVSHEPRAYRTWGEAMVAGEARMATEEFRTTRAKPLFGGEVYTVPMFIAKAILSNRRPNHRTGTFRLRLQMIPLFEEDNH